MALNLRHLSGGDLIFCDISSSSGIFRSHHRVQPSNGLTCVHRLSCARISKYGIGVEPGICYIIVKIYEFGGTLSAGLNISTGKQSYFETIHPASLLEAVLIVRLKLTLGPGDALNIYDREKKYFILHGFFRTRKHCIRSCNGSGKKT